MTQAYTVLKDSILEPKARAGVTVYRCILFDYGIGDGDTRMTGIEHGIFTLKPDGSYPFFSMPMRDVELLMGIEKR